MKRLLSILLISGGVLLALLLLVRFAGSPWVTAMANRKLAALPEYSGKVGAIHLALWRGTVSADDFQLIRREHEGDGPVITVRHATLSVAWLPLFRGRIGGQGMVEGIEVVIAKDPEPASESKGKKEAPAVRKWQAILREAFPMELSRFEIKDATIKFSDRTAQPAAEMVIARFHLIATNLANRPQPGAALPAELVVQARVGGTGRLNVEVRADPAKAQPTFTSRMELKDLELVRLHDFLVKYALIDVSHGTFEVYSEINAGDGHYDGYLKPFFKDLEFKAVPDPSKNFAQRAVAKVASAAKGLLKNDKGEVATKAPFKGDFVDNQLDLWTTIENLLRNAFVQSLSAGLEGHSPSK